MVPSLSIRKHSLYIQLTGLMSIVSLIIVCVSIGSQAWIQASAIPKEDQGASPSNINYGLFKGKLTRRLLNSPTEYDLFFTCIWGENACAWSCGKDEDSRKSEVELLVSGKKPDFSCLKAQRTTNFVKIQPLMSDETSHSRIFTNAGLWLSTIIFLVILIIALFVSVVLSILNCLKSPIETFLNIQGIYLANEIAIVANFIVLLLYGVCYDIYMKEDISIYDTIVGDFSSDASLDYSYWILLLPCVLQAVGIFFIAMREKIVNSDRTETKIDIATDTPATGVLF